MPKIMNIEGYQISIWSNENGEPVHVHISKRKPTCNSYKMWLTSSGYFIPANCNDKRIPANDLRRITMKLNQNANIILNCWVSFHGYVKFYV